MLSFLFKHNTLDDLATPSTATNPRAQYHDHALALYSSGNYERAAKMFNSPTMNYWPHRMTLLVKCYDKLRDYDTLEALSLVPDSFNRKNTDLLFIVANALFELGRNSNNDQSSRRLNSALETINLALVDRPYAHHYRLLRAQILTELGDNDSLHWSNRDYAVLLEVFTGDRLARAFLARARNYSTMMRNFPAKHFVAGLQAMIFGDLENALWYATVDSTVSETHLEMARYYEGTGGVADNYNAINSYMLYMYYSNEADESAHASIFEKIRSLEGTSQ